jgi:hypothetical protein
MTGLQQQLFLVIDVQKEMLLDLNKNAKVYVVEHFLNCENANKTLILKIT